MSNAITGLWVALATPLDATGAVDHGALVRHVRFLMERGCDGVVPFGTTGFSEFLAKVPMSFFESEAGE